MDDPHTDQPIETAGPSLADADAAVLLTHGRGATAQGMLDLASEIDATGVSYRALQARQRTWYPNSFMAPIEANEPWLSSALSFLDRAVDEVIDAGLSHETIVFVGFSQGACLASEYVARNPRRYGGHAALSGGVIGPDGTDFDYEGDLAGTPSFLGCSDVDPHIPVERVHETHDVLQGLGADVTESIYQGMGHTVNQDELDTVESLVHDVVDAT